MPNGERGEDVVPEFEVFTHRGMQGDGGGPFVTVQRGGSFALTPVADQLLGRPEAVELMYDRERRVMGFRAVASTIPHGYRVRAQKGSSSRLVSGKAFTRHYGIATDTARRYPATMIGDVLAVKLNDEAMKTARQTEDAAV
jgi:hypothetical protein